MKKNSSLIRRAIVFTAAIVATVVVVALLAYLLTFARQGGAMAVVWSLLIGLGAGLIAFYPLLTALIAPVATHIGRLRDVAVAVARGDLDERADERAPGELGELGKALNNLSYQLSRNMYLLIIERNRLKQMLNGLSEGIVAVNAKGRVTHHNPALDRMFAGFAREKNARDERLKIIPDRGVWADFDRVVADGKAVERNPRSARARAARGHCPRWWTKSAPPPAPWACFPTSRNWNAWSARGATMWPTFPTKCARR